MSVTIVAIEYQEPEYALTRQCIEACNVPVVYINRNGCGSLAKAINEGVKKVKTEFTWIITNVTFTPQCLIQLMSAIILKETAAVTPVFSSDHKANRKGPGRVRYVPFIEFTAPLVRTDTIKKFPLDEDMPYWGHDLDWGFRLRKAGKLIAVSDFAEVQHTYIRFNKHGHSITDKRKLFREFTNYSTECSLKKKYGNDWKRTLGYL